ncbi:YybH family protein [Sphingomonas rubra]|uniref:DUF4440 domain-containing protein n=1 Tax=Sphingomonas rubra TaxID=634430 RepID=A0A1I5RWS1_9SPHN|nr:SgcJ/EcaC family oxidoreductase [Sphingomonas rubra]SFP62965.1 conserved hypothetical protein [Sphingomonas rubra]
MIGLILAAQVAAAPASLLAAPMAASAAGWNAGDLTAFMAVYADDALFVTAKGVVRGKAAIAARYAPSFAKSGNTRGRLSFEPLVERTIDATHRLLVARWTLTGAKVESGMTTLLFERRGGAWKIIADHSS